MCARASAAAATALNVVLVAPRACRPWSCVEAGANSDGPIGDGIPALTAVGCHSYAIATHAVVAPTLQYLGRGRGELAAGLHALPDYPHRRADAEMRRRGALR